MTIIFLENPTGMRLIALANLPNKDTLTFELQDRWTEQWRTLQKFEISKKTAAELGNRLIEWGRP